MEEILDALEGDYLIEILYLSPAGGRTVRVTYARDNPPPDRYACPEKHCRRGGFNLKEVLGGMVRSRLAAVAADTAANRAIDEQFQAQCEGSILEEDRPDRKCTQPFTVWLRATLKA